MTLMLATAALGRVYTPITVSSNWGSTSNAAPAAVTSPTRTLTVPAGNPGNLLFTAGPGAEYSKNGGAYASVTSGSGNPWANGDTLTFRFPSPTLAGTDVTIDVEDATAGDPVGQAFLQAT